MADVIDECIDCNEKDDIYSMNVICPNCYGDYYKDNDIKEKIKNVSMNYTWLWEERDKYIGFKTEEEKTIYMKGIRQGFDFAMFYLSLDFGDDFVEYFNSYDDIFHKIYLKE